MALLSADLSLFTVVVFYVAGFGFTISEEGCFDELRDFFADGRWLLQVRLSALQAVVLFPSVF
jgi:hypothetical protein